MILNIIVLLIFMGLAGLAQEACKSQNTAANFVGAVLYALLLLFFLASLSSSNSKN